MELVFLLIGLVVAAVATFLVLKTKWQGSTQASEARGSLLETQIQELKLALQEKESAFIGLTAQCSAKEAELRNMQQRLQEQRQEMLEMGERLNKEFRLLANEILEEKSKKFTEQNQENLGQLLKPLSEKIRDFEKRVEETYDKESKERFSLSNVITSYSIHYTKLYDCPQVHRKQAEIQPLHQGGRGTWERP